MVSKKRKRIKEADWVASNWRARVLVQACVWVQGGLTAKELRKTVQEYRAACALADYERLPEWRKKEFKEQRKRGKGQ